MKTFKILVWQMLAILAFVILVCLFIDKDPMERRQDEVEPYQKDWEVEAAGRSAYYERLPEDVDAGGDGEIVLTKELRKLDPGIKDLCFFTSHQLVTVSIGGEVVYEVQVEPRLRSKTPGNLWNFVELPQSAEGEELRIEIQNCYRSGKVDVPDFYYGSKAAFVLHYLSTQVLPLVVCIVMLVIGVVLVVVYFMLHNSMHVSEAALWLGMFAIPLSIWSAMECQVFGLFTARAILLSRVTFAVMKLLPIPILQFVAVIYDISSDKGISLLCKLSIVDFWACAILQILGWLDYKETVWVTLAICSAAALYVLFRTFLLLQEKGRHSAKGKRAIFVHMVCVSVVAVCVLLDVVSYFFSQSMDSARFSRFALLGYIIVLAIQLLNDSFQLIRAGQEAGELRIEADTDAMTKLGNRRSFDRELYALEKEDAAYYGIFVCDLNNLKKFNDSYGHSVGDTYIILSSEIIQDAIGRYGNVYRTGGDEFCAIVKNVDDELAEYIQQEINKRLHSLTGTDHLESMSVAVGFSEFDAHEDASLVDTMKRADKRMYQRKREMKAAAV